MKISKYLLSSVMGLALLSSCQNNSYRIEGSGESLIDGDTLYLTTDLTELTPTDSIVVKDGKFVIEGETDSTFFCLLYSATNNQLAIPFFVEPGTVKMELPAKLENARVSGTLCNREWQIVSDTMALMSKQMNQLAAQMYGGQLNVEQQAKAEAQIDQLNERFRQFIYRTGKRNINNEFGYFIVTFYGQGMIDPSQCKELIEQMPDALRQRDMIRKMEEKLKMIQSTNEGSAITDFTMADIEGNNVSILSEVKINKLTVLDFWASWCGPCRREMPNVKAVYEKYHDKGLGIIGISLDEKKEAWVQAVNELGIKWLQVSDLKGWDNAAARMFNIEAIPHMIVLDQQGHIVKFSTHASELEALCSTKLQ